MTPDFPAMSELLRFIGALSVLSGAAAWWTKDGPDGDAIVSEAADVVIGGACNADTVNKIDLHTGRNLRDQISIEQMEDLHRERELRRWPNRN